MYKEFYYYGRKYKVDEFGNIIRSEYSRKLMQANQYTSYMCERKYKEIHMKSYIDEDGYKNIGLYGNNSHNRIFRLHHIVYLVWVENRKCIDDFGIGYSFQNKNYIQINHIDGNKLNNHFTNLEKVSLQENIQHAVKTGIHNSQLKSWYVDIYKDGKFITTLWKLRNVSEWLFEKTGVMIDAAVISDSIKTGKVIQKIPEYSFKINSKTDLSLTKTKRRVE